MSDDKENKRHVREIVNSEIEISNRYVHRVVGLEINSDQVTVETKRKKTLFLTSQSTFATSRV